MEYRLAQARQQLRLCHSEERDSHAIATAASGRNPSGHVPSALGTRHGTTSVRVRSASTTTSWLEANYVQGLPES